MVLTLINTVFAQETAAAAKEQWRVIVEGVRLGARDTLGLAPKGHIPNQQGVAEDIILATRAVAMAMRYGYATLPFTMAVGLESLHAFDPGCAPEG